MLKKTPKIPQNIKQKTILQVFLIIAILLVLNIIASSLYTRFDLTKEKRFTLTPATKQLLQTINEDVVYIKVYLQGDFPAGFKRLQNATIEMLNEFRAYSGNNIEYEFIDPFADATDAKQRQAVLDALAQKGINPIRLIENSNEYSEKVVFPGAVAYYKNRELPIVLLQEQLNKTSEETLNNSIAMLEYNLANAIQKIQKNDKPTIAFVTGNGELPAEEVQDISALLAQYYVIERIDINHAITIPATKYSALIVARPTQKFEEANKYKIDQYIMNGGKVLWLVENLRAHMDSLQNKTGSFIAMDYGLNLEDMLFKYGARINFDLVQDLQCTKIPLTVGTDRYGNAQQLQLFNWVYFPVITDHNNQHPASKNLDAVLTQFSGTIDTIKTPKTDVTKTVLLRTSPYTNVNNAPWRVDVSLVRQKPDPAQFNKGKQAIAVALEGDFESVFKNRLAFTTLQMVDTLQGGVAKFKEKTDKKSKMVVVADGDVIRNEYDTYNSRAYPLGYYKYTKQTFANKEFIVNAIEWLTDDNGIIDARSKEVKVRLLDAQRIKTEKTQWQLINLVLPILTTAFFGIAYNYFRRRKYTI